METFLGLLYVSRCVSHILRLDEGTPQRSSGQSSRVHVYVDVCCPVFR